MTKSFACAVPMLLIVTAASAQDLRPIENYSVHLGSVSGSVYFDKTDGDPQLVATLSGGPDATPVRIMTTLAAGQSTIVSVPRGPAEPALEVKFIRRGDHIVVQDANTVVGSIR